MKTLCVLVKSVYQKYDSSDASVEIVDVLVGIDTADCQMRVGVCMTKIDIECN